MNKKLNKVAKSIMTLLKRHQAQDGVVLYWNNQRTLYNSGLGEWIVEEEIDVKEYFKLGDPDTLCIAFDGIFYRSINYSLHPTLKNQFVKLLDKYDLRFEQGDAWNMNLYEKVSQMYIKPDNKSYEI